MSLSMYSGRTTTASMYSSRTTLTSVRESSMNLSECSWKSVGALSLLEMSVSEMLQGMEDMTTSIINIEMENDVYTKYLNRVEPELLDNLQEEIDLQERQDRRGQHLNNLMGVSSSLDPRSKWQSKSEDVGRLSMYNPGVRQSTAGLGRQSTLHLGGLGRQSTLNLGGLGRQSTLNLGGLGSVRTPSSQPSIKINLQLKMELVSREIEESRVAIDKEQKRYKKLKNKRRVHMEHLEIMLRDTQKTYADFKKNVVALSADNIARRIPAERFVLFMDKWLKHTVAQKCSLGLKVEKYRKKFLEVKVALKVRTELVENLHPIDIDVVKKDLLISERMLTNKLACIEEMTGLVGPIERNALLEKGKVKQQSAELQAIMDSIRKTRISVADMEKQIAVTQTKVDVARERLKALRLHVRSHVPVDPTDYLHVKLEEYRLKNEIKVLTRRNEVQHMKLLANQRRSQRTRPRRNRWNVESKAY